MALVLPSSSLDRLRELNDVLDTRCGDYELSNFFVRSPDLLGIVSQTGFLCRFNPSWLAELGWSHDELNCCDFVKRLVHPDDQERMRQALLLDAHDDAKRCTCRLVTNAGDYSTVEFLITQWLNSCTYLIGRPIKAACVKCSESGKTFSDIPPMINITRGNDAQSIHKAND